MNKPNQVFCQEFCSNYEMVCKSRWDVFHNELEIRRKNLNLKFAQSGIKHDKLNDLFPLNDKIHKMQTRKDEKYEVLFANTNRLKNGSIITMQNMLNTNAEKT